MADRNTVLNKLGYYEIQDSSMLVGGVVLRFMTSVSDLVVSTDAFDSCCLG